MSDHITDAKVDALVARHDAAAKATPPARPERGSCGAYQHTVAQVGDAEWRCWRCGADQSVMEREEEEAGHAPPSPQD